MTKDNGTRVGSVEVETELGGNLRISLRGAYFILGVVQVDRDDIPDLVTALERHGVIAPRAQADEVTALRAALERAADTIFDLACKVPGEIAMSNALAAQDSIRDAFGFPAPKVDAKPVAREPIPMILTCPACNARHIDEGAFATKPHHTHACQSCGMCWRPAVVPTAGVRFLPEFKNAATDPSPSPGAPVPVDAPDCAWCDHPNDAHVSERCPRRRCRAIGCTCGYYTPRAALAPESLDAQRGGGR
jgi:hypothetical protein